MTSFIPNPPNSKDQPYAKPFLTFHVLRSTGTAGALFSVPTAIASTFYLGPKTLSTFATRLLTHSFRGTLAGLAFGVIALEGRMWGREHIEWQERTSKLLRNKGQVEVDHWILGGEVVGGAAAIIAARRGLLPIVLKEKMGQTIVGAMGLGAVAGTGEYMIWRHGIKRGKFDDASVEAEESPQLVAGIMKH